MNNVELFTVLTSEDSKNYFSGEVQTTDECPSWPTLPSGFYRVVDGELFRIVDLLRMES